MRIGYSFWGFLGPGITDTPDGGRSHRRTLIDGLHRRRARHRVPATPTATWTKPGYDLRRPLPWDDGLPDIDALFLEWRWPIPGRNTTACGSPGHTCDLHRQDELLDHYTARHRLRRSCGTRTGNCRPTRPAARPCRNVTVCEAACTQRRRGQPAVPRRRRRPRRAPTRSPGRDARPTAAGLRRQPVRPRRRVRPLLRARPPPEHRTWSPGNGPAPTAWPHVSFIGRSRSPTSASCTVGAGHGAAAARPVRRRRADDPAALRGRARRLPAPHPGQRSVRRRVHAPGTARGHRATQAADRISRLPGHRRTAEHAELIADCLARLDLFRLPASSPSSTAFSEARPMPVSACPAAGARRRPLASRPMDRIAIIGCGGSGKSTSPAHSATSLGHHAHPPRRPVLRRGLEHAGQGGVRRPAARPRRRAAVDHRRQLRLHPADPAEAADTVIFLDLPALDLPVGHRSSAGCGTAAASTTAIGVYDRITWNFIRYILGYRKHDGPARPRPDRRARRNAQVDRPAQPPRRPPLPRDVAAPGSSRPGRAAAMRTAR